MDFMQNTDTSSDNSVRNLLNNDDSPNAEIVRLLSSIDVKKGDAYLDIGCGSWQVAEAICEKIGLNYMGAGDDEERLSSLKLRGFYGITVDITDESDLESLITSICSSGTVAFVSLVGVLEYLKNPRVVLALLHREMSKNNIPLIVSIQNLSRQDIGFKLAFGHLDLRREGLLRNSPVSLYTEDSFLTMMNEAGWHQIASCDTRKRINKQSSNVIHPLFSEHTPIGSMLHELISVANEQAEIHQFVRMFLPGPHIDGSSLVSDIAENAAPFLSVITRTQGKRHDSLRDVLLCLSAQTDTDIEVIVVGHKLTPEGRLVVQRIIGETNDHFQRKIKLYELDYGNRTAPLNFGCAHATGDYFAILDDDDIVFANWVETFKNIAKKHPGQIVRSVSVSQKWKNIDTIWSRNALRSTDAFKLEYQTKFCLHDHFVCNNTPPVSIAFPRAVFSDLKYRFDETLTTTEDWDFFMRTAFICGVRDSESVTSVYRHWEGSESSYTLHSEQEWADNRSIILAKFNRMKLVISRLDIAEKPNSLPPVALCHLSSVVTVAPETAELLEKAHCLLHSKSWRITAPLRLVGRLLGRPRFMVAMLWKYDVDSLRQLINNIETSSSWKMARPLRVIWRAMKNRGAGNG